MSLKNSPLNYTEHGKVKIKSSNNYQHVNSQQVVPLIVHEFSQASAEMPVVFVKNSESGQFQPVAILGFKSGENLFVQQEKWLSDYVPAYVTHHPFALMPSADDETKLQIIMSESSSLVTESEGNALFDEQGNETEYLQKRKNALGNYYENMQVSQAFVNFLSEKELLQQRTLTIELNGEKLNLTGLYLVDEKALNALSDEDFLILRKRGYLGALYAHLGSLHQLKRLADLKTSNK